MYSQGQYTQVRLEKPVLEGIPPMQKRRLSPLARVVFHVLDYCTKSGQQTPVVFSSVMGEIKRTQEILDAMAADETVSPASFSLSVHNSIGGLWSLVRDNRAPMLALAPVDGSPVPALIEAAGLLAEGHFSEVTVVFYDEDFPAFYAPFLQGPAAPYAVALTLSGAPDDVENFVALKLSQRPSKERLPQWDNSLDLIGVLSQNGSSVSICEPRCNWFLERC